VFSSCSAALAAASLSKKFFDKIPAFSELQKVLKMVD